MGSIAAVRILHRRRLAELPEDIRAEVEQELADEHELIAGGIEKAKALGVVDEVIEPSATRSALAAAIVAAAPLRGRHGNIPL
jgi:acetyl-CoA/propionyl-CoA carboxylase carboxyl transferase subunit